MNVNQSSLQDILNQDFESSNSFSFVAKKKTSGHCNNIGGATVSSTMNSITPELRRQRDSNKTAKGAVPGYADILSEEEGKADGDTAQDTVLLLTTPTQGVPPSLPGQEPAAIASPTGVPAGRDKAQSLEMFPGVLDFDDDKEWEEMEAEEEKDGSCWVSLAASLGQSDQETIANRTYSSLDDSSESETKSGKHKVFQRLARRKSHFYKKGHEVVIKRSNIGSAAAVGESGGAEDKSDSDTSAPAKPDDEWRMQQLESISLSGLEGIMSEILPSYGDSDSSLAHSDIMVSETAGQYPKTRQNSYRELQRKHMEISSFLDEQVASSAHDRPFYFPSQFLPISFHSHFFEYMNRKHRAVLYLQTKNTRNLQKVVNLIRKYIVEMSIRKLGGHADEFPDDAEFINLRNVFKMWYCNSFGVRPEYYEGNKGRGKRYTETEIFAIEFGMYKYPAAKKVGVVGEEDFDFRWGPMLQDRNLKRDLAGRSKEQIAEKAKTMCTEKIWDSLKYFYVQQLLLCRDILNAKEKLFRYIKKNADRKRKRPSLFAR
jgi:hypothetical protein